MKLAGAKETCHIDPEKKYSLDDGEFSLHELETSATRQKEELASLLLEGSPVEGDLKQMVTNLRDSALYLEGVLSVAVKGHAGSPSIRAAQEEAENFSTFAVSLMELCDAYEAGQEARPRVFKELPRGSRQGGIVVGPSGSRR